MNDSDELTLDGLCREIHKRLNAGEPWDKDLFREITEHPALIQVLKHQAGRFRWIDKSLSIDVLAHEVLGVVWERLRGLKLEDAGYCRSRFLKFIRWCFWHLPTSKLRRKDNHGGAISSESTTRDSPAMTTDASCSSEVLSEYQEKLLESTLQASLRKLDQKTAIAMRLLLKHHLTQKEIAAVLGISQSALSDMIRPAKLAVVSFIDEWRQGFGAEHP